MPSTELVPFIAETQLGRRLWQADSLDHAAEQHYDAFPDESIVSIEQGGVRYVLDPSNGEWGVYD